ncbi:GEVED domain-containing protein [Flavobacterium sp. DG2-3]|nr:GEVED domain-containing protein [Flavobacterium sp. DG2-3]
MCTPSLLLCVGMFFVVSFAHAVTYYSRVTTGFFAINGTWSVNRNGNPTNNSNLANGDNFIIQNGHTITVNANERLNNITVEAGGTLIVGGYDFRVDGTTTIAGTLIHNSTAGTKSYYELVTINLGGIWNNTGNSAINFRRGITNSGTFNAGTGSHTFTNNIQSISGTLSIPNISISQNLTNLGVLTVSSSLAGGATFINSTNATLNYGGTVINPTLTATASGNVVNYNGSINQTIKSATYNNLEVSGTNTKSLSANTTINSSLSIGLGSTLDVSTNSYALNIGASFTNNGTFIPRSGTVTLNGSGIQSFNTSNFYNLTLSGSGTKSFTGTTSITGALVVNSGVKADLGTVTHSASTLTLNGNQVAPTSWGSSSSSAQNKDDLYFTATTGQINVGSSACTTFSSVTAITNVLFGSINNATSASSTAPYIYYSNVPAANVSKGQYYELTVKGNTNGGVNSYYTAFFDWNGDGDFADTDEGPHKIGTINNSNGTDAKATSIYLQIPAGATAGLTKMRIMSRRTTDYNTNSCAISGSTGQIQDYNITILEACVGNAPGNTLTTAATVCPNAPFTLSLQNTMAEGTSYVWQTSPDGNAPWTSATPTPTAFFSSAFATNQSANTNVGEISLYGNNTSISGGELFLTTLGTGYTGGFVIQKTPGTNINTFSASFDYKIYGGNGADGISLSYASNIANNIGGGESGEGSGIVLQLDTYDNEGVEAGSRVRITYNGSSIFNSAINAPFNLRTSSLRNVVMSVSDKGYLTLTIGGNVVVANLALPAAYLSSDKSNWKFKFSGRTGDVNDYHVIDNVNIYYLDTANSKSTFTTTQTVKTYYRVAASCGGATVYSTPVMVDVTSATINTMTSNACTGVAFSVTPVNVTNGTVPNNTTYTWTMPLVTGGMLGAAANTIAVSNITGRLTNSTTTAQTATYTVTPITGSCTGVPFTLTVTVNPIPTAPSTSHTNVSCGNSGTITLTGLPSADWTVNQTGQMGSHSYSRVTNETTLTIENLEAGTYHFTVTNNSSSCISSTADVTISDLRSITIWNGSGWSNGNPKDDLTGNKTARISSVTPSQPFSVATVNLTVCSLEITVPGTDQVIIPSNMTLTVTNGITSNGNLSFESGSSLLQGENAVNSGNVFYKRQVSLTRYDVVYWATPLIKADFKMRNFSPNTLYDKYHYWDANNTKWIYSIDGEEFMEVGKGYSIRAPQNFDLVTPSTFEGVFVGVPNNGDVTVTTVPNKLNLIGNPYPSAVDAEELILNTNKDVLGSIYLWTHNQPPQIAPGTNTYKYLSSDFIVYNGVGTTRVNNDPVNPADEFNGNIAAGQSFFASPTVSEIYFNNDLRRGSSENTQFYKTAKTSKIQKNRLWLNIANTQGAFKQMLIGYIDGATNSNDLSYDATTMNSNSSVDFYSINESKRLTIQGRALPFDNTEVIPLGYKSTVDATGDRNFTISIDHADGFFDTQEIYLEDKATGKIIDLRKENYTFFSAAGTNTTRFALRYTNKTLGTGDFENLENTVLVSVKDKAVKITSSKETIKEVNIYNVGAQLLYSNDKVNASELQTTNLHSSDQVILVKITLENGHTFTKKVIFSNL